MTTRMIENRPIIFDADGFMANPNEWDRGVATALAQEIGIEPLTNRHWAVIDFVRNDFKTKGEPPTLRRITKTSGVPTKELYQLFPKGPAKKVALVAGLGKPKGCI